MRCRSCFWAVVGILSCCMAAQAQTPGGPGHFDGLNMTLGNLPRLSKAQSRSISAENFTGEKGKAGMATKGTGAGAARELGQGWKVSPSVSIKAKSTFTVADINGSGAIQQIWMTPAPLDSTRLLVLRFYWDGESRAVGRGAAGRFLRLRLGQVLPDQLAAGLRQPGQRVQLLLDDAVPQACEDHLGEPRPTKTCRSTIRSTTRSPRCPRTRPIFMPSSAA